jgi:hypothetical protein
MSKLFKSIKFQWIRIFQLNWNDMKSSFPRTLFNWYSSFVSILILFIRRFHSNGFNDQYHSSSFQFVPTSLWFELELLFFLIWRLIRIDDEDFYPDKEFLYFVNKTNNEQCHWMKFIRTPEHVFNWNHRKFHWNQFGRLNRERAFNKRRWR